MTRVTVEQVYDEAVKQVGGQGTRGEGRENVEGDLLPRAAGLLSPAGHPPLDGVTVFLDRDGTLNYDPGYLKVAADLKLLAGVGPALARLKDAGAKLVVVTNQSGVGRGLFTLKDLEAIHARLEGLLAQEGGALDAIYFCPHHPDDGCHCRKPNAGMVERAVSELQLDLRRSYLIGDHARDIQLAKRVGAKAILLTTESVDAQALEALRVAEAMPDAVAPSMVEAVDWIFTDVLKSAKERNEWEKRERQEL